MKIGSLFSGIGGIELGFERTGGFETIWFVENEPYAQAVLRKHWPNTPIYGDIKTINFTKLEQPDILTGGFPCQDISNAGQRKGIEGQRSGLWKEFLRAISQIRPKYALVENVSALTYRGLLTVLGDLTEIGYDAEWHCLPASAIGAPHRRDRIYILAYTNNNSNTPHKRKAGKKEKIQSKHWEEGCTRLPRRTGSNTNLLANSNKQGLERRQPQRKTERILGKNSYETRTKQRLRKKNRQETWATDTGILRVAHGIPNRIHRIKCIGNAVVPQCAEFFAEIIKEKEKEVIL